MSGDATIGNVFGTAPAASDTRDSSEAVQQRVRQMAEQFEAMLMTQMLRDMRQSMLSDEEDEKGLGKDTMTDTLDIELGGLLARAGGFGLASVLSKAIEQRGGQGAMLAPDASLANNILPLPPPISSGAPRSIESPGIEPASADPENFEVPRGRVSSAFGWRSDPFTGVPRFHNGIDVAQAYGQDVRTVADGQVIFSGDRGSYGNTVIVEHSGGRQTLYAHLSALDVRAGDEVGSGQIIGKSGSSGRSTGPHLHFEVLEDGRPVDPSSGT